MSATPEKFSTGGDTPSASTVPVGVRTRTVVPGRWVLVAACAAVALAAVVFMLLPRWLAPGPTTGLPVAISVAVPAPAQAPDAAETVRQRLAADEARLRYEKRLQAVRDQRAEAWAAEDLAAAIDVAGAAAAAVTAGDWLGGANRYDEASGRLDGVAGRAESVYADALARGEAAIQADQQRQAIDAYRQAMAIHPDAGPALAGLARAEALDKVLAQMSIGTAHARAGEWAAARSAYAEAAKLDPGYGPAKEALARVERNVANQRFVQLITRGLAYLDRADWPGAEQAFRAAGRLRPGDRSAADGLARAKEGLERTRLAEIRSESQQLESAERWTEALAAYQRALTVDPTLEFARRGIERSERMARLHAELDTLLADPQRLYSPQVREGARKLLASANAAPAGGPRLAQSRERLDLALRRATTPIAVRFASDDATDVSVHHVGLLGRFQARELELTPGTYTVVGSRAGYRDVRVELIVDPDAPAPRVFIACREPV